MYPQYQNYPNYYPNYNPTYPSYQQPIQPTQTPQSTTPNPTLVWVQNEDEAQKYPLSVGQSIFLMNQSDNYIYMKSVDQLGKTTFMKKRLVDETDDNNNSIDLSEYIRREELEDLITDKIQKEVEKRVSQISFKPTRKKQVIVDEDEE